MHVWSRKVGGGSKYRPRRDIADGEKQHLNYIKRAEHIAPLAYAPDTEHNRPIMSTIWGDVGRF